MDWIPHEWKKKTLKDPHFCNYLDVVSLQTVFHYINQTIDWQRFQVCFVLVPATSKHLLPNDGSSDRALLDAIWQAAWDRKRQDKFEFGWFGPTSESESGAVRIGSLNFAGLLILFLGFGKASILLKTSVWTPFAVLFVLWKISLPRPSTPFAWLRPTKNHWSSPIAFVICFENWRKP